MNDEILYTTMQEVDELINNNARNTFYYNLSDELQSNVEVLKKMVNKYNFFICEVVKRARSKEAKNIFFNKNIMLELIKIDGRVYKHIDKSLNDDKELFEMSIYYSNIKWYEAICYASSNIQNNIEYLIYVIKNDIYSLKKANQINDITKNNLLVAYEILKCNKDFKKTITLSWCGNEIKNMLNKKLNCNVDLVSEDKDFINNAYEYIENYLKENDGTIKEEKIENKEVKKEEKIENKEVKKEKKELEENNNKSIKGIINLINIDLKKEYEDLIALKNELLKVKESKNDINNQINSLSKILSDLTKLSVEQNKKIAKLENKIDASYNSIISLAAEVEAKILELKK